MWGHLIFSTYLKKMFKKDGQPQIFTEFQNKSKAFQPYPATAICSYYAQKLFGVPPPNVLDSMYL